MSYILDALRKSERERQAGQVPGLSDLAAGQRHAPPRWVFWLVGLLLGVNLAGLGYWLFLGPAAGPAPSATPPGSLNSPVAERAAPPASPAAHADQATLVSPIVNPGPPPAPALILPGQPVMPATAPVASPALPPPVQSAVPVPPAPVAAIPAPAVPPPPVQEEAPPAAYPPAPPAAPALKAPARTRRQPPVADSPEDFTAFDAPARPAVPRLRPAPNARAEAMDDADLERETEEELLADARTFDRITAPLVAARAGRNGIPYLRDLPPSFQERIPPLKISMFAYSRNPAERFVIIDMKKHRVGDQIPGGALLMEIQAENLLLELDGQKFLLPRF